MLAVVQTEFRYRGRNISGADIESVRQLIADHPGLSRRRLSAKLCQTWNWVQANGQLRDMVARGLMLQLHRAGLIVLPAKRKSVPNNAARHRAPLLEPSLEVAPLECDLADLGPLEIRQVRRTPEEALFGRLLRTYHYLGYRRPVGEHVKCGHAPSLDSASLISRGDGVAGHYESGRLGDLSCEEKERRKRNRTQERPALSDSRRRAGRTFPVHDH